MIFLTDKNSTNNCEINQRYKREDESGNTSYANYKVLRATVTTERQATELEKLIEHYDFFSPISVSFISCFFSQSNEKMLILLKGHGRVDILQPPDDKGRLQGFLDGLGIPSEEIISNIQELIDQEEKEQREAIREEEENSARQGRKTDQMSFGRYYTYRELVEYMQALRGMCAKALDN